MGSKQKQALAFALSMPLFALTTAADASSHREAPAISKDAFADNTDTYVFMSPENSANVVLAASWIPFEAPDGGPNYFEWDDDVVYKIYVDSDGDAAPNWMYSLTSRTEILDNTTFLYNTQTIDADTGANWNRQQFITVTETNMSNGSVTTLVSDQRTSPVNIGSKSTPNYQNYVDSAIYTSNGAKVFAGQTDDAFFVDLQVFDLLTLRGQDAPIGYSSGNNDPVDSLSGYNAHTLVIEVPVTRVQSGDEPVLGVWSTSERIVNGSAAQISRLGMPLTNEVVIPMFAKDTFNGLAPENDLGVYVDQAGFKGLLQEAVENPELGTLLCALYSVPLPGDANGDCNTEYTEVTADGTNARSGRGDIFDIFLTGMVLANEFTINTPNGAVTLPAGTNVNRPANAVPAEMLRINTAIASNEALCSNPPSSLGVLGGDACGFPNGRRLFDDAVDIEILAVAGAAYQALDGRDEDFSFNSGLISVLTDGINANDKAFSDTFPYFALAAAGQERTHDNPDSSVTNDNSNNDDGGGALGLSTLVLGLFASLMLGLRRQVRVVVK